MMTAVPTTSSKMKHHERIEKRLGSIPNGTKIDKGVANKLLRDTPGRIWYSNGRYGWSTRRATCYKFNSARAALYDIIEYFKEGGY